MKTQVDHLFAAYTKPGSPGLALAVMKDGDILYTQGYGLANVEHHIPITPQTVFNIGSIAKQFTALAVLLLVEMGRLSLDDDIRTHIPELADYGATVTIRHLIHHIGGIRCSFPSLLTLAGWRESDATTNADVLRLARAQRELNFPPGEEFSYSNMGYVLLAYIVKRVSGQTFASFCAERIFNPLGMAQTRIFDNFKAVVLNRAQSYYTLDDGTLINAVLSDCVVRPTNVYTTAEDMARWEANFFTGAVGGMDVIRQMHQPGVLNDGTVLDYAFGLEVGHTYRGQPLVEHGGGQGGYCSWVVRFPAAQCSVIVLFNVFLWEARAFALKVADVVLADMLEPAAEPSPAGKPAVFELHKDQLRVLAGTYYNARKAAVRDVILNEGRLQIRGLDMRPVSDTRFAYESLPDDVHADFVLENGRPVQLCIVDGGKETRYDRVNAAQPDDLGAYAGRYYSPELDVYWTLVAEGDHLIVQRHKYNNTPLTPVFADVFTDDWSAVVGWPMQYIVEFERDNNRAVTGFSVSDDRMRHLRFVRFQGLLDQKVG